MNLLEFEAKNILGRYRVPIPRGEVAKSTAAPFLPCVLKSQVPVGGRGKAGGIRVVASHDEYVEAFDTIKHLSIKGYLPTSILCEEVIAIDKEYYLAVMVDRTHSRIEIVAHHEGGIEVESHDNDEFYHREITSATIDAIGQELADYLDISGKYHLLADLLQQLLECFKGSDALLTEINPLILTKEGKLVAGDCKMTLDNAAAFRHEEWDFSETSQSANFVTLDPDGTVATIANGAGLAMATVDAVKDAGLRPANFLDIGGNATKDGIVDSFNQLVKFNNLTNIIINIFGGIVQCDTVARAIIEAQRTAPSLPALQIRLSGTNADIARDLLYTEGLVLHDTLEDCLEEIVR